MDSTYEDQIDPELLARVEEWQRAQTSPIEDDEGELESLMQETPHHDADEVARWRAVDCVVHEFLQVDDDDEEGLSPTRVRELTRMGHAHRGVLSRNEREVLDRDELRRRVEERLGFTRDELQRVMRPGRPSREHAELSRRVSSRLAALHANGANFDVLANVLNVSRQALHDRAARWRKP